jgi:hypothetical protein
MGRYGGSGKNEVENSNALNIFWLNQEGYLCGWRSGTVRWKIGGNVVSSIGIDVKVMGREAYIGFNYTTTFFATGEKKDFDYKVQLTTTPCNFGGKRYWFICPLIRNGIACNKRVGVLYLPSGASYFGCRHCYDLTYQSCNRSHRYRMLDKTLGASFQEDELWEQVEIGKKRLKYDGRPTRFARKIKKLQERYSGIDLLELEKRL